MLDSLSRNIAQGPMLWYLNRGSGVALLLVLTAMLCLGILSARAGRARLVPRFVGQQLHRNLGVLALVLVVGHVLTAVADTYVDIRWWQALSPVRQRLGPKAWRALHLTGYLAWPLAMVHSVGIGTDASSSWGRQVGLACMAVVGAAALVRITADAFAGRRRVALPDVVQDAA